jgi:hypothetical protein
MAKKPVEFRAVTKRDLLQLIADLEVNDLTPESFYNHVYFTKSPHRAETLLKLIERLGASFRAPKPWQKNLGQTVDEERGVTVKVEDVERL